jgi:hypothetical protein
MFYGQRNTRFFSFSRGPLSITDEEAREIRDILIDININRDSDLNDRLKDLSIKAGSLIKGKRKIYREEDPSPIDNFEIIDDMGELYLAKVEFKPLNMDPEIARFSPGALYDLEEQEREKE